MQPAYLFWGDVIDIFCHNLRIVCTSYLFVES